MKLYKYGDKKPLFSTEEASLEQVYYRLVSMFPSEQILLRGYNFEPVLNYEHFRSLGTLDIHLEGDVDSSILREPAHFNPPFYYID